MRVVTVGKLLNGVFASFKKIRSQRKFKNLVRSIEWFLGWIEANGRPSAEGDELA